MNLLKTIFGQNNNDASELMLKFSKRAQEWQVIKGESIVCMGEEILCRRYLRNYMAAS